MVLVWKMDLSCARNFFRRIARALRYAVWQPHADIKRTF